MTSMPDIRARLADVGDQPDHLVDLSETTLLLAALNRRGVPIAPYRRHLERLAGEVGSYAGGASGDDLDLRAEALSQVISRRYGYVGCDDDQADDGDDANLMRVIDRRRGCSAVLGVIYLHAARAQAWSVAAIDFPPRLLVRLELGGRRVLLDPVDGGCTLSAPDLRALYKAVAGNHAELTPDDYRPASNREILMRIQNYVKHHHLRAERFDDALGEVETMLLIAPDTPGLWRDAGLLHARLDNIRAAVAALEEYLSRSPGDAGRYRASVLLQELRGRLS